LVSKKAKRAAKTFLGRYTGATREVYECNLRTFYSFCDEAGRDPIKDSSRELVEQYLQYCIRVRENAVSTVNGRLFQLRSFYALATDDELVRKDPTRLVRQIRGGRPPRRTYLTRNEIGSLVSAAKDWLPQHEAFVMLMTHMGLRVSEVVNLDISSIRSSGDYNTLQFVGKNRDEFEVVIPVPVMRAIYRAIGDRTEGPLILCASGKRQTRNGAYLWVKSLAKRAGIDKDVSPHSLRRSYVTGAFNAGLSLREVQHGARHVDPKTTMLYDQGYKNLDAHANHTVSAFFSVGV
jgi:site-specific recombinase XerD